MLSKKHIETAIFGLAVGDALGVPVEFQSRDRLEKDPVRDLREYGTHRQPKGTWSDDSSLTFCLMESLSKGFDLENIGVRFMEWMYESYWTPHGSVFDVGIGTRLAISEFSRGTKAELCGGIDEYSNGNGSLMRILPMAFHLFHEEGMEVRYDKVKRVSSVTHGHFRSCFACFFYVELAIALIKLGDKYQAYKQTQNTVLEFAKEKEFNESELTLFKRVLQADIGKLNQDKIRSSGYVLDSLEASLWAFLSEDSYKDIVLKAVNLGDDTDTTGAIAGGLAGLHYGFDNQFDFWRMQLARFEDIEALIQRFYKQIENEILKDK